MPQALGPLGPEAKLARSRIRCRPLRSRDFRYRRHTDRLRATSARRDDPLCHAKGAVKDLLGRPASVRRIPASRLRHDRGRGLPPVRDLGAWLRAGKVRRLRLVPRRRVFLSTARLLPELYRPPHGRFRGPPRRSRDACRPTAPVGPDRADRAIRIPPLADMGCWSGWALAVGSAPFSVESELVGRRSIANGNAASGP